MKEINIDIANPRKNVLNILVIQLPPKVKILIFLEP